MPKVADLNKTSEAVTEQTKKEIGGLETLLVNTRAPSKDLHEEADIRLDCVQNMLQDLGALGDSEMMREGYQGACFAASLLINDSLRLIRTARERAKAEGVEND